LSEKGFCALLIPTPNHLGTNDGKGEMMVVHGEWDDWSVSPTKAVTWYVSHCGLAIYMEKVSEGKRKNYGNSNISPCKKT
jgi:hypothetical protein